MTPRSVWAEGTLAASCVIDRGGPGYRPIVIEIRVATKVDAELVEAFARLVPQLSESSALPTSRTLGEIIDSDCSTLLLAVDTERTGASAIVGSLTLVIFRIPTGLRAWIEDVVVDSSATRSGVGEALNRRALEIAAERGARSVDLTSRPSRGAANRLYLRLGFSPRETNVYRYVT
jgi:ribosomal protein S18 acetylase RimI-like enzyme